MLVHADGPALGSACLVGRPLIAVSLADFIIHAHGYAAMLGDDGSTPETRFELTHALEWPKRAA